MVSNAERRRRSAGRHAPAPKRERLEEERPQGPVPKRKYALVFGYNGVNYHGMQKQIPGSPMAHLPTIEGVLQEALKSIGSFTQVQCEDYERLQWSRVGRTDKGVHAACQVVTCKLTLGLPSEDELALKQGVVTGAITDPESVEKAENLQRARELDFLRRLREKLPDDFSVFDITRVPGQYDARMQCQKRQYEYCFPAHILRPVELTDNTASLERFFAEFASEYKPTQGPQQMVVPFEQKRKLYEALRSNAVSVPYEMCKEGSEEGAICERMRWELFHTRKAYSMLSDEAKVAVWAAFDSAPADNVAPVYPPAALLALSQPVLEDVTSHSMPEAEFERFRALLKRFEGHHNWFNYTSRITDTDPSARRHIWSVELYRGFQSATEGEILVVRLQGQSFLLNQIRKMMSMAVEATIGTAPYHAAGYLLQEPLTPKKHLHLAPGEGLLLERAYFDTLNRNTKTEIPKMGDFADAYEAEHPFGDEMQALLRSGLLRRAAPAAPSAKNPLLDDDDDDAVPAEAAVPTEEPATWFAQPYDDWPIWFKILKYKFETLHPHMVEVFTRDKVFGRYVRDILWHPFFVENFPRPCPKDYFQASSSSL